MAFSSSSVSIPFGLAALTRSCAPLSLSLSLSLFLFLQLQIFTLLSTSPDRVGNRILWLPWGKFRVFPEKWVGSRVSKKNQKRDTHSHQKWIIPPKECRRRSHHHHQHGKQIDDGSPHKNAANGGRAAGRDRGIDKKSGQGHFVRRDI